MSNVLEMKNELDSLPFYSRTHTEISQSALELVGNMYDVALINAQN